jgi:hypothetical protein
LKLELIRRENFATREAIRQAAFEDIGLDCYQTRRHSANGCISPLGFEMNNIAY